MEAPQATARALFAVLATVGAVIGGWSEASPHGFYRGFPGFGRDWLPPLGPYNEHLLRDFGALNLGLGVAAGVAAVTLTRSAAAAAAGAWIVYSAPHLAFHAGHTAPYSAGDNVADLTLLSLVLVVAALALLLVWSSTEPG